MYKLFLSFRYLRERRIAYFAVAAVMLCVAMVLIVLSVMGGWLETVKRQARGLLGDVIIDNRDYSGFPLYQEFIDEITAWPEIERATPVIYTVGLFHIRSTRQTDMVKVVGLRLHDTYKVNAFKDSLFYEKYYPRTTHLGEQRQPLVGSYRDRPPIPIEDNTGRFVHPPELPSSYQEALAEARRLHREQARRHGGDKVLRDPDSVATPLNRELELLHQPPIPGYYAENREDEVPKLAGDPHPGIIFGRELVAKRHADGKYNRYYPRGTLVQVTLMATSLHGQVDPIPKRRPFRYVDDSRTGIYEIDSQHVYCDFNLLQKLLEMGPAERGYLDPDTDEFVVTGTAPARCSQIQIKLAPGVNAAEITARLEELYWSYLNDPRFDRTLDLTDRQLIGRIDALTWQESQADIVAAVEKEKILITIVLGFVSLVAVALVLCILYMIVVQKTRDIGVIKAIGGSSAGVAFVFLTYGATAGLVGSALGLVFGGLFVTYINDIQDFLIQINPAWRVWNLEVYSFDRIPSEVSPTDAFFVVVFAVVASTVGALAAAWRAGAMQPVEAIRYE